MGPTFLDQVAKKFGRYILVSQKNLSGLEHSNPVREESPCLSDMHNLAGERVVEKATVCMEQPDTPVPVHIERHKAPVEQTAANSPLEAPVTKHNHHYEDRSTYFQDRNGCSKPAMQMEIQPDQRNERDEDQKVYENTVTVPPVLALRHKEVENSNALPKLNIVAGKSKQSKRGVQIGDAGDLTVETLRNRIAFLGSAEVSKMQETLLSSSLGLQAVVKDPLPEVLTLADAVRSGVGRTPLNAEPSAEAQDGLDKLFKQRRREFQPGPFARHQNDDKGDETHLDARALDSFVNRNPEVVDRTGDNIGTKRSYLEISATRGEFLWRNCTGQTYEVWERKVEDDMCAYRKIFEARTEVDLKDKWRNIEKESIHRSHNHLYSFISIQVVLNMEDISTVQIIHPL